MRAIGDWIRGWLDLFRVRVDPLEFGVRKARVALNRIAGRGILVPDDIKTPILRASMLVRTGQVSSEVEDAFYGAYARLVRLTPREQLDENGGLSDPFEDALSDSELLLKYAAETGTEVPQDVVEPILSAQTLHARGQVSDTDKGRFYAAYSKLAKLFGEVTADTIRNCASPETRRNLARHRVFAVGLTIVIAAFSVFTFVADSISKAIVQDISIANALAVKLRADLTPPDGSETIDPIYARQDPCTLIEEPPPAQARTVHRVEDVQPLQEFTSTMRELRGRAIKLNSMVFRAECDPFGACGVPEHDNNLPDPDSLNRQLQLNPTILNYPAEVLCKIRSYQLVRTFASNVQADYAAMGGAFASFALPIFYSLLGAYAYRLRLFGETIRKRTYHPSFSDSARMITAVIAGAIAGLFNPAQGLSLSPLATAFLVGYGVELFFRFLDTLINAFGSQQSSARRP